MIRLLPAIEADAQEVVLRAEDWAEVVALGRDPVEALAFSIRSADEAWTARDEQGRIICIGGVTPLTLIGATACPWLLGSDLVCQHRREFLRETRRMVDDWQERWPVLRNLVDARYAAAIRWLRRLKFSIGEPKPVETGALFCVAERVNR